MPVATPPTTAPTSPSKGRVFAMRLLSTIILWCLLYAACNWRSNALFIGISAFFGLGTAAEYFRLLKHEKGTAAYRALGFGIAVAWWAVTIYYLISQQKGPPIWLDVGAITVAVQGSFFLAYRTSLEGTLTLQRIFSTVFGVIYTVVFYGFLVRIQFSPPGGGDGLVLLLFVVMVTKFSDMGAYGFGVIFGKHKMIPHISPAKSWEGLFGAFAGAFLAGSIVLWLGLAHLDPINWKTGLIIIPVLCALGVAGDLAESVLKRCFAIKDSGHSLPGIGGILDLTDSLLFTAPVFYYYLQGLEAA